jgi:hypothetical protein
MNAAASVEAGTVHPVSAAEAFELGMLFAFATQGHVLDGRDVGRLTTCDFWPPLLQNMHIGLDLHVGLSKGEAICKLKKEILRRLNAQSSEHAQPGEGAVV